VPNNKHMILFVDLILNLEYAPLDWSVFLHTLKSGLAMSYHMTKPYILSDLPSRVYIPPLGIIYPQQACAPNPSNYCDFTPKWQSLSPGGCPDACQLLYNSKTLLLCQRQPAQAPWLASKAAHSQWSAPPCWYCLTTQEAFMPQWHPPNSYECPRKAGLKTVIEQKRPFHFFQGLIGGGALEQGGLVT